MSESAVEDTLAYADTHPGEIESSIRDNNLTFDELKRVLPDMEMHKISALDIGRLNLPCWFVVRGVGETAPFEALQQDKPWLSVEATVCLVDQRLGSLSISHSR